MNRHERERVAQESVEIVDRGHYRHPESGRVDIAEAVAVLDPTPDHRYMEPFEGLASDN
jgi:hypothetical protein